MHKKFVNFLTARRGRRSWRSLRRGRPCIWMQSTSRSLDTADLNSAMAAIEKTSDPEKGSVTAEEHPNIWIHYSMEC